MRHESERVPGKNYRDFGGQPLYTHILNTLSQCDFISQIVVDTDSTIIKTGLQEHFPAVHIIDRPVNLQGGHVPMNDILLHDTSQVQADFYLQTHTTNPLLQAKTIKNAVHSLLEQYPMYDSLFGVTRLQTRLWDQLANPINHNPAILLRTQDLPPIYEENSNLYLFTREILVNRHNRIGNRPLMFEIDRLEAWDINDENDFQIAELIYHQ